MIETSAMFVNGIGDAILALPALRCLDAHSRLRRIFIPPASQIAHIFEEFEDRLQPLEVNPTGSGYDFDAQQVLGGTAEDAYFFGFLTWTSASMKATTKAMLPRTISVGFFPHYEFRIEDAGLPNVEKYHRLVERVFRAARGERRDDRHVSRMWQKIPAAIKASIHARARKCVVHPFTASGRNHSFAFWRDVLRALLERYPDATFFVIGDERNLAIKSTFDDPRVIFVPPPFPIATYLISIADAFVGIDSCFMHYADLHRTPAVGIFRSASIELWGLGITPSRENVATHTLSEDEAAARVLDACGRVFGACLDL